MGAFQVLFRYKALMAKARLSTRDGQWLFELSKDGTAKVLEFTKAKAVQPGIGDAVAAVTTAVGIKPCGGCAKRKDAMNKATPGWVGKILSWFKR